MSKSRDKFTVADLAGMPPAEAFKILVSLPKDEARELMLEIGNTNYELCANLETQFLIANLNANAQDEK